MSLFERQSLIGRFSAGFITRYRITVLLFLALLGLGYISYTQWLKIEGFPPVEVPIVIIEADYFVNDARRADAEITQPIEHALGQVPEIVELSSTTLPFGATIVAQFEESLTSEVGATIVRDAVQADVSVPEGAAINYRTINAGAFDGEHDLLFELSGDFTVSELQAKAQEVAAEVEKESSIATATALNLVTEEVNPVTGQTFENQNRFNRVGYRDDGSMVFAPAVSVGVIAKPDISIVDISNGVKDRVKRLQDVNALEGFTVTYGGDPSVGVLRQREQLEQNALAGFIAVVVLIFLLIDWRASIVGGLFIPLVFAATFLALYLIGYSLNIISLFALILVLGIFVDNATVVVDAVERAKDRGLRGIRSIREAIGEVGPSIIAGTWTTVLVFLPMAFIAGVLGKFIVLIPITVIAALLVSLVMALVIVPWLSHIFLREHTTQIFHSHAKRYLSSLIDGVGHGVNWLAERVGRIITRATKRGWVIFGMIVISLGLISFGGNYAGRLDFSVFPPAKDTEALTVSLAFPSGSTLAEAESAAKGFEAILADQLGDDLVSLTYYGANQRSAFVIAELTRTSQRERTSPEMTEELKPRFDDFADARVRVEPSGVGPTPDEFQFNVRVFGDTQEELVGASENIKAFLQDRDLSEGESVIQVVTERLDVLSKVDGERYALVRAKVSDPTKTNLVLELQDEVEAEYTPEKLSGLGLRDDAVRFDLGQEGENVESFQSAVTALILALIVMYGLLVFQFNSFSQPLLIFLAIPFSFTFLFPALYWTNNDLSFFVMLGIIALSGVVVNNTILLINTANRYRADGKSIPEAIGNAVQTRFRAIVTTTATTIAALLPLALSDPFWESLSFTIIFGLASSVLLVLSAFPAYYVVVEKVRDWKDRKFPGLKTVQD